MVLQLHAWAYRGQVGLHGIVCSEIYSVCRQNTSKKRITVAKHRENQRSSKFVASISGLEGADFLILQILTEQNGTQVSNNFCASTESVSSK